MIGNRVATYARFSSNNQREESITAQERAMKKYCEENHYLIVASYRDEAKSATSDNRPQFLQAIADSEKGLFDILLVHKLDRFSRNRYDSAIYRSKLKKNGVKVCSVLERLDDSPESVILEALLEGMGEYYSRSLSIEVSKGMTENAYAAKFTGGHTPYGFFIDENMKYAINESEADAVRLMFAMCTKGYGYTAIMKELDRLGYRTRKGEPFSKGTINNMLQNEKYKGVYIYRKQNPRKGSLNYGTKTEPIRIEGGCPHIVSDEIFDKVQRQMKLNRYNNLNHHGRNRTGYVALLRGITFCGECGKRMVINSRTGGRRGGVFYTFRCPSKNHICNNREFNRDYLDDYVVMLLEKHLFNRMSMKRAIARVNDVSQKVHSQTELQIKELSEQLGIISISMENIITVLEQTGGSETLIAKVSVLEAKKHDIEKQIHKHEEILAQLQEDINGDMILDYYNEVKESGDRYEYRTLVMEYVESVTVFANHVVIRLRTGLGKVDDLDTTFDIKRGEIYEYCGSRVKSA